MLGAEAGRKNELGLVRIETQSFGIFEGLKEPFHHSPIRKPARAPRGTLKDPGHPEQEPPSGRDQIAQIPWPQCLHARRSFKNKFFVTSQLSSLTPETASFM